MMYQRYVDGMMYEYMYVQYPPDERTYVIYEVNLKRPGKASILDNIFFTYNIEMFIWYCKDDVHLFVYSRDNYINPRLSNISRVEDNTLYIHTNQFELKTKNA